MTENLYDIGNFAVGLVSLALIVLGFVMVVINTIKLQMM
jgi:cell division protein FtsX